MPLSADRLKTRQGRRGSGARGRRARAGPARRRARLIAATHLRRRQHQQRVVLVGCRSAGAPPAPPPRPAPCLDLDAKIEHAARVLHQAERPQPGHRRRRQARVPPAARPAAPAANSRRPARPRRRPRCRPAATATARPGRPHAARAGRPRRRRGSTGRRKRRGCGCRGPGAAPGRAICATARRYSVQWPSIRSRRDPVGAEHVPVEQRPLGARLAPVPLHRRLQRRVERRHGAVARICSTRSASTSWHGPISRRGRNARSPRPAMMPSLRMVVRFSIDPSSSRYHHWSMVTFLTGLPGCSASVHCQWNARPAALAGGGADHVVRGGLVTGPAPIRRMCQIRVVGASCPTCRHLHHVQRRRRPRRRPWQSVVTMLVGWPDRSSSTPQDRTWPVKNATGSSAGPAA